MRSRIIAKTTSDSHDDPTFPTAQDGNFQNTLEIPRRVLLKFTGTLLTGILFTYTTAIAAIANEAPSNGSLERLERLEIDHAQDSIQNQELTSGPVKVVVNYEPIDIGSDRLENNL